MPGRVRRVWQGVTVAVALGMLAGAVVVSNSMGGGLAGQSPIETVSTFSIRVPTNWVRGEKLAVSVPKHGQIILDVPPGDHAGQEFMFSVGHRAAPAAGWQSLDTLPGGSVGAPPLNDLSLDGMLTYERKIRESMGKMRNTWQKLHQSVFNLAKGTSTLAAQSFDDADFIPEADAPSEPGWDPTNPNGFAGTKPDLQNATGIPGYTFTTNGELLGVVDQGAGYYRLKDPEHNADYLRMLRLDCFGSNAKWRDHSNCAALVHRSHLYNNADAFRFSGAFGWNPPFPAGSNVTNKAGATAPDKSEYWNYGSDDDFAGAALWNGKKFVPPPPPPPPATA